jgi:hypothetical protein
MFRIGVALALSCIPSPLCATSIQLTPVSCCDGELIQTQVAGVSVWQTAGADVYMYFRLPSAFLSTTTKPVYLRITYFDAGSGYVGVQYDSTKGTYVQSEVHTRSRRVGSNAFVNAYKELQTPSGLGRLNGNTDFRISILPLGEPTGSIPLSISSVTISDTAFTDDPRFQQAVSQPWLSTYSGPQDSHPDDSTTLKGKVMVGYQGWFFCPNDLDDDLIWNGWSASPPTLTSIQYPRLQDLVVDMWPDLTQYPDSAKCLVPSLTTQSGQPAYLFSSTYPEVVDLHFSWMQRNNIDGAFVQRFLVSPAAIDGFPEWRIANVRQAANQRGRIWAIEYDISDNNNPSEAQTLQRWIADWKWLVDVFGITKDPRYARENGKPVVAIWGFGFATGSYFSVASANAIIDFLKNDPVYGGNYLIGGIPNTWLELTDWLDVYKRFDGLLVWQSQNYQTDKAAFSRWGVDYYPHVWPGFSWQNEHQSATPPGGGQDREGGQFYWGKLYDAIQSGSDRLFVGMFDEYNEGTAIMPMSNDPPPVPPIWGTWVTNEGKPSDWWLRLTSAGKAMLLGQRPLRITMPAVFESPGNRGRR